MSNYQINLFAMDPLTFVICFSGFLLLLTIYLLCNLSDRDIQKIHDFLFSQNQYSYPMMGDHIDYQVLREISIIRDESDDENKTQ